METLLSHLWVSIYIKSIITFTLARLGRNQEINGMNTFLAFIALIWILPVLSNLQADFQQNLMFQSFCLGINLNA